jgi:hypothetical protein
VIIKKDKSERKPPTLPSRDDVKAAVSEALGVPVQISPTWVNRAMMTLRSIRNGAAERYARVDDVQLLDRVTNDADGHVYYHLTTQARELLRTNKGLPWGNG